MPPGGFTVSHLVEEWVWHECQLQGRLRLVLLAVARHCARDDGTGSYPSESRLARMARVNVKTLRSDIRRLEDAGELLVWRPAVAARGRSNQYAVVMARDPADVRRLVEEPHRPARAAATPATEHPRHRPGRTGPEPVQNRSRTGPESRSALDRNPESRTLRRASASRSSPARAAPPDDPRLEPLRRELAGIDVSWQMTEEQAASTAALLEVHGVRALAQVALDLVTARGRPTFARAWIGAWRELPVPGAAADRGVRTSDVPTARGEVSWCGQCDDAGYRWEVDDEGMPVRPCRRCHPMSTMPARF
jgi:hypothetical protein